MPAFKYAEFVVRTKLVRSPDSAAVAAAEAIGHSVLSTLGLAVVDGFAVSVTSEFATDLTTQYAFSEPVFAGRHWGTRRLQKNVLEIKYEHKHAATLEDRREIFTIFLADVVLANPDRKSYGNVLLLTETSGNCRLIPIDQSECFNHPTCFRDKQQLDNCRDNSIAPWLPGTEALVMDLGTSFVNDEIARVRSLRSTIVGAVHDAPDEWYGRAGINPDDISAFLGYRVDNLSKLAALTYWEGLASIGVANVPILP